MMYLFVWCLSINELVRLWCMKMLGGAIELYFSSVNEGEFVKTLCCNFCITGPIKQKTNGCDVGAQDREHWRKLIYCGGL